MDAWGRFGSSKTIKISKKKKTEILNNFSRPSGYRYMSFREGRGGGFNAKNCLFDKQRMLSYLIRKQKRKKGGEEEKKSLKGLILNRTKFVNGRKVASST